MALAIILAFTMTLITASSNIVLKKGFSRIYPFVAVYISVAIGTLFLWAATFLFVPRNFFYNYKGILIFAAIGSFAPTIVRTLTYYGIHNLGAGRAASLRATTPFFATIMAVIFLRESPGIGIFLGILLIVSGITFLSKKDEKDSFSWRTFHFIYPLGAAILAGAAANLRKYGLNLMPQPIFASTIAATSSLIILTPYVFFKYRPLNNIGLHNKRELRFIIIAAFLTSCGEIVDLSALLYGKVSLVVPIFATTPLVTVLLSRAFLKKQEMITGKLILATVLILCGVWLAIINA
ncbi:MAG: DMT family transporter [Candidatus Omnitrophota bacterium]|jgi:drug/metabolite transporter (DMT)-like permease